LDRASIRVFAVPGEEDARRVTGDTTYYVSAGDRNVDIDVTNPGLKWRAAGKRDV
jgi:hypothetical protein